MLVPLNFQIEEFLGLPPGTLRNIRVGRAEVTFKVVQNNKNLNATDIVSSIGNLRLFYFNIRIKLRTKCQMKMNSIVRGQ